ncbi:acyltransferase family protein [Terriglobus saanensis]|uniref:Acyltransferase family protein n=1 Tax=Terriglobus saanensis (strain ATCC BAA-1853 / DSM 23119 / SP1PR4) TaxID=401053 RepID=E8UZR0_TERSS|nr:acyltransferase [Terriglobus saanensis]ADV84403.1 acyltransferase family protein [Terriglobus saanensis SP1PR4]
MTKPNERLPFLDNAKLGMMFLVVYGHILEPSALAGSCRVASTVYFLIYCFHVPVWVFLAGITSKAKPSPRSLLGILCVLIVSQAVYFCFVGEMRRNFLRFLVTPWWALWFLLSLVLWKLMLPVFLRVRWALPVSVALALLAGCESHIGRAFSLSRTLAWFPLFFAGHLYGRGVLRVAARTPRFVKVSAVTTFAAAGIGLWFFPPPLQAIYEAQSYVVLGFSSVTAGIGFRALHLFVACALGFLALCLIPVGQNRFTKYGQRTLTMLVVHPLVLKILEARLLSHMGCSALMVVLCAVLAALVTWFSGAAVFHRAVTWIYRASSRTTSTS